MLNVNRSAFVITSAIVTLLTTASEGHAQSACYEALEESKTTLEDGRDISVEIQFRDFMSYSDHPPGKPDAYMLNLSGSAVPDVMHSPQLQTSIATNIIQSCETIGIVQFGVYQSSWVDTFGLMSDGSVERFQCQEPGTPISRIWGNIGCS